MAEPAKKTDALDYASPVGKQLGIRYYIGLPIMIFGFVTVVMFTVKHLKEQPREPLGFDLTLRWGYGGFIAYGVAAAIVGFIVMASARKK